jgi:hypothetical protein
MIAWLQSKGATSHHLHKASARLMCATWSWIRGGRSGRPDDAAARAWAEPVDPDLPAMRSVLKLQELTR